MLRMRWLSVISPWCTVDPSFVAPWCGCVALNFWPLSGRAWGRSHLIPMRRSFGHKSLHCTSPTAQYRHIFIFADEAHWASLGCLWYTTFSKHLPFIADESCLVGVPDGINGGGGAGGLFVLASVCCFIACRCWIFNISGFSIMALAKFVLLLLMLMP